MKFSRSSLVRTLALACGLLGASLSVVAQSAPAGEGIVGLGRRLHA
jgi:hypothetical protein